MIVKSPDENAHKMYFQLRYITTDFEFLDQQISVSNPQKKMEFLLKKRVDEDATNPPLEGGDGFVTVTCEREMTERLQKEAIESGVLSVKKGAVDSIRREMYGYMLRTMHLIRWRANSHERPNPIRSGLHDGFRWSLDSIEWKTVADCISVEFTVQTVPKWNDEAEQFLATETTWRVGRASWP